MVVRICKGLDRSSIIEGEFFMIRFGFVVSKEIMIIVIKVRKFVFWNEVVVVGMWGRYKFELCMVLS